MGNIKKEITAEQLEYLKTNYPIKSMGEISRAIGINRVTLKRMAVDKGIKIVIPTTRHNAIYRREYLQDNYKTQSVGDIANQLGVSKSCIYMMAREIGINVVVDNQTKINKESFKLTPEKLQYIKEHYADTSVNELSEKLDLTITYIRYVACKYGLTRIIINRTCKKESTIRKERAIKCKELIQEKPKKFKSKLNEVLHEIKQKEHYYPIFKK